MLKGFYLTLMMGPLSTSPVPGEVIDALLRISVTNSAGQASGFQLTFALSRDSPIGRELLPDGFFDPPNRVQILITVYGQTEVIMDGVITRQEVAPSNQPGASTLTITGSDVSQMMDLIDFSGFPWPAMPAEARVAVMIAKYAPYGMIPAIVPTPFIAVENPINKIPSQRGTDLNYIKQLANDVGYTFYLDSILTDIPYVDNLLVDVQGVKNIAYWGPEVKVGSVGSVQPALSVNLDADTNVESLSFSYDGLGKKVHLFWVKPEQSPLSFPLPVPDISILNPPLGKSVPMPLGTVNLNTPDNPKKDDATAKLDIPKAIMRGLARAADSANVISASGSLDVTRYGRVLKARQLVDVRGAGELYDGTYYVKSVTHNIQRGSYKQNFTLSRNARRSLTSRVGGSLVSKVGGYLTSKVEDIL
jgi:hypothetical protein